MCNNDQVAVAKIFNKIWPDIMFAKRRIARLKTLALYEINSIITKNGAIATGAPLGKNKLKNFKPCKRNPVKIIFTKDVIDKKNVKIIELVIV